MANAPIPDWRLKLKRAQSHFDSLRESIEGFVNSDAYGFSLTEPKPGSEQNAWVSQLLLRIREQPPIDDWALIISDIVHNTRSALDIMVFQAATNPGERTAFPIHIRESDFKSTGIPKISCLPEPHRALIEREQPYNRWKDDPASDPLAILADLDNASKHRVIPTVASSFGADELRITSTDVGEVRVVATGLHPPEDGAPLALLIYFATGPNPKMKVEPRKAPHIVFGEGADRAVEKHVYETLVAIGTRVKTLVAEFENEA